MSIFISRWNRSVAVLACVASVSVLFRSKERGTRVKDCAKNWVSLVPFFARPKEIPQEINTGIHIKRLMTSQSVKITFAQSKNKNLPQHTPPVFLSLSFKWSSALLILSSDGSGSLHCVTKGIIVWCAFVLQPISCRKKRLVSFQLKYSRRPVLNFEIYFPKKNVFRGFLWSGNLILEWSGVEPV